MQNSIIFTKHSISTKKHVFIHFDCCESLGDHFNRVGCNEMFVGIPDVEMDDFFRNEENLKAYLELITRTFKIKYEIATEEDKEKIDLTTMSSYNSEKMWFFKITKDNGSYTNKYLNVPYNLFRYLWYHHYTNMAIIATNLYRSGIFEDLMDIWAIACSYQNKEGRAILPKGTIGLAGLLFFRSRENLLRDLNTGTQFNSVFYKYPIYFDPEVMIKGSFFEEASSVVRAKELIGKLSGVDDISIIPKSMMDTLGLIKDEYERMKVNYVEITKKLSEKKYAMSGSNALLLSKQRPNISFSVVEPTGFSTDVSFQLIQ